VFTGRVGKYVPIRDTCVGAEVLDARRRPAGAGFFLQGTIDDVRAAAEKMLADALLLEIVTPERLVYPTR